MFAAILAAVALGLTAELAGASPRRGGARLDDGSYLAEPVGPERSMTLAKRVLITDDAMFMRVTLKNILTQNGYEVAGEAANGKDAVRLYQDLKPDLVTMDITMPEMDGIAALKEIKKLDPDAVVVMCTAMGQKNLVVEAIQAGAKDFIVKPFQPPRVLESLRKLVG